VIYAIPIWNSSLNKKKRLEISSLFFPDPDA
jgi:hypothetical protein